MSADIRNVAIIGHKGSGKTSLAEAMLYVAKATPKLGRVDDRSSFLDDTNEEKEHAATLEASVASLSWGGKKITIVDTPGEGSFLAETRLALAAVDAALLVVSGRDGVQPVTERVFGWCREAKLPVLVVVTKVDAENARPDEVVAEVRARLKAPIAVVEHPIGEGSSFRGVVAIRTKKAWLDKPEAPSAIAPVAIPGDVAGEVERARGKLVDDVAGTTDELTEKYLTEGDLTQSELDQGLREAMRAGSITPLYYASGTRPAGIAALLDAIVELGPAPEMHPAWRGELPSARAGGASGGRDPLERAPKDDAPAAAFVFKTSIDQHAGRTSWVRVLSGVLRPETSMLNASTGISERVGKISHALGKEHKQLEEGRAGDIVAIGKLKTTLSGQTLSDEKHPFLFIAPALPPALFSRGVKFEAKSGEDKVAAALHRLAEEDPGLAVHQEEATRELVVSGLGALHLEITVERIRRRIGIDCHLGPPHIAYKETLSAKATGIEGKHKKQTGGHGQFGVCIIDMEPLPRGGGFVFEDAVVGGAIPRQFIPSVEKGIVKSMARGFLAGFPMVDVKVRLHDGKYHDVDSSDAAFQMAGSKAFKAAAAKCRPVLLEPVVKLRVQVPSLHMGDIIGDIISRRGRVTGTDNVDDQAIINAFAPLSELLEYESKLKSMTQGKGTFTMSVDHMDVCPPVIQEKVVRESGFKVAEDED
ncbi:elongation factor G [Chondromyces crocatus]|uniref:Elongation factor G n=1 Tax=Chondromyces crocatus TaxID=52 RepID=A0A0K1ER38_CHOCO|nr:elongation factor G [Chondromyces crocatus]AKT43063.1 elongation factor G [Chondromyces crocatus]